MTALKVKKIPQMKTAVGLKMNLGIISFCALGAIFYSTFYLKFVFFGKNKWPLDAFVFKFEPP